jgi:hypothetical protein
VQNADLNTTNNVDIRLSTTAKPKPTRLDTAGVHCWLGARRGIDRHRRSRAEPAAIAQAVLAILNDPA